MDTEKQVYSVAQIIDMGIEVALKFKALHDTITSYDGRVTGLEQTDADTELRLVELESNTGGGSSLTMQEVRDEIAHWGVYRDVYAGSGWYKDANGRVYSKDVPSGEAKTFPNDPNTYINILDSDLTSTKLSTLVRGHTAPMFATSNLTKLSYDDYGRLTSIGSKLRVRDNTTGRNRLLDVSSWDVGHITNFDSAFAGTPDIIGLDKIDVSNMVSANKMLYNSSPHKDTPTYISKWDTSKLTNGESMFEGFRFSSTTADSGLSSLDTSSLTNAKNMLKGSYHSGNSVVDLSGWDVSKLVNAEGMFNNMLIPGDMVIGLDGWRVGNVTNMDGMLAGVYGAVFDLSNWCVTNIPVEPTEFGSIPAEKRPVWGTCPYAGYGWYKDPVTGTVECNGVPAGETHTFEGDPKEYVSVYEGMLSTSNMGVAATSNMTNMDNLFSGIFGLPDEDISHWDVKNVESMDYFMVNTRFNGDLSNWKAPLIPAKPVGFLYGTPIENDLSKHPQWGAGA